MENNKQKIEKDDMLLVDDIYDWKKRTCDHKDLDYYNHGYHAICKKCGKQVY